MAIDPITLEVISSSLSGIVREMETSLFRTGYSTIIRESQDASCAILDRKGRLVGQHITIYFHIGSFPAIIESLLQSYPYEEIAPGDAFLVNHPYLGGSPHAMDMAVITPVFHDSELVGFCGSMAHKSDLGGLVPGSGSGQAREIFHEGIHFPPVKCARGQKLSKEIEAIIRANSRTPDVVLGDIQGQIGTCRLGEMRVENLMNKYGKGLVLGCFEELFDITEKRVRSEIARWPDGRAEMEAFLDNDGIDLERPVRLHLSVVKEQDRVLFDFSGSAPQCKGPVNLRPPLVRAACYYGVIAMVDPRLPNNYGLHRCIAVNCGEKTVTNPALPAPVNCYAQTLILATEMVVATLAKLAGRKAIACSGGGQTMAMGGRTEAGQSYVQYEILRSGAGAVDGDDGGFGAGLRCSNQAIKLAPLEILEAEFPVRFLQFHLIPDSGGPGKFRGGPGYVREYLMLGEETRLSTRSDKFVMEPWGVGGGMAGRRGAAIVNPDSPTERRLPARVGDVILKSGDILRLELCGGGGVGDPHERGRSKVLADLENGYITAEAAKSIYGVTSVSSPLEGED